MSGRMKDAVPGQAPEEERVYEELFTAFSAAAEKILLRLAVVFAVLLIVAQLALLHPAIREALVRVERLEGIPFGSARQIEQR